MMKKSKRAFALVLVMSLIFMIIPQTIFAAGAVSIDTRDEPTHHFQNKTADGSGWTDLKTPQHFVSGSSPEQVSYCLQHKKDSPHGNSASEFNPISKYSFRTRKGLQIIIENGYPFSKGGLTANQARYATANAIRFWLGEETDAPNDDLYGFDNLKDRPGEVRAKSGDTNKDVWDFCMELLNLARKQELMKHEIKFTPSKLTLIEDEGYYVGETTVMLTNIGGNYKLDKTGLPSGTVIEGFTGKVSEKLTIKIPVRANTANITAVLKVEAKDDRVQTNLSWYRPGSSSLQDVLLVGRDMEIVDDATISMDTPALGKLELEKIGNDGGSQKGATFEIYDSAGKLVQTLKTRSSSPRPTSLTRSPYPML